MTDYILLWQQTVSQLQLQMPRATFDGLGLAVSEVRALEGDTLTIYTPHPLALDWLNGPQNKVVTRAVGLVFGQPLRVVFVNGSAPAPALRPARTPSGTPRRREEEPAADPAALIIAQFDQLQNHWIKHPRYFSLFYQPYLNTFGYFAGSRALGVWQFVRDLWDDKKYDKAWTPVWEVGLKELCQLTGLTPHRLNGVWRACPVFEQAFEEGQVIECCGRYGQGRREEPPVNCRYWQPGVLQLLAEHVLLAIQKTGTSNRNTKLFVQVYQRPLLLTPWQARRLGSEAQAAHQTFLLELGIDLEAWQQVETVTLAAAWFDRSGLTLPSERDAVLSLNRLNKFFLPPDGVYLDAIGEEADPKPA